MSIQKMPWCLQGAAPNRSLSWFLTYAVIWANYGLWRIPYYYGFKFKLTIIVLTSINMWLKSLWYNHTIELYIYNMILSGSILSNYVYIYIYHTHIYICIIICIYKIIIIIIYISYYTAHEWILMALPTFDFWGAKNAAEGGRAFRPKATPLGLGRGDPSALGNSRSLGGKKSSLWVVIKTGY